MEKAKCPYCNQTLLYVEFVKGEIKCIRCRKIIELNIPKDRA